MSPDDYRRMSPPRRERQAMTINDVDARMAGRAAAVPVVIENLFKPYPPMRGVVPANGATMAMDALPAVINNPLTAFQGLSSIAHEGLYFMGFPYLAQLGQRAEYRHAYEIWAEHTTRNWIKWKGPAEKLKQIEAEFVRLNVRAIIQHAAEVDGLFGRSQIFMDFDNADDAVELATELAMVPEKVSEARPLARLRVVEPVWSYPMPYNTTNPLAADFYVPSGWYVMGKEVHASRLLTIVGRPLPDMLKPQYAFAGQSLCALMKPYVDNWLRNRQSGSNLLNAFSVMVLATDMETTLQNGGASALNNRITMFNNYRDNQGAMVVDKNSEELTNVSAPIAGVEGLVGQSQEQMAAAARIPLSIYLQITPSGLNASSENEIRSFYADVHAYQETTQRGPLETISKAVQLGLFGVIDPEITFSFNPLWEMSDTDKAAIRASDANAVKAYVDMGAVDNEEARAKLRADEDGLFRGVELDEAAPEASEPDGAGGDDDADAQPD